MIEWGVALDSANHGGALVDNHSQITAGDDQNKRLFNGYLYSSTRDTLGVNVRGLRDLYASYDVYVYFDADNEHSLSGNSVATSRTAPRRSC